jgi:hypothetical protein
MGYGCDKGVQIDEAHWKTPLEFSESGMLAKPFLRCLMTSISADEMPSMTDRAMLRTLNPNL